MEAIKTHLSVTVYRESSCKLEDGEYWIEIHTINAGSINESTFSLVEDAISEVINDKLCPEESYREWDLIESGEWEDVFWNSYFLVLGVKEYDKSGIEVFSWINDDHVNLAEELRLKAKADARMLSARIEAGS